MLLASLVLAAVTAAAPDETVARVGGHAIPASAVTTRLAASAAAGGSTRPADLVEDLVNDELLAREAERLGLARDPAVVSEVERQRRQLAADRFVEKEIFAAVRPDEAMLRELYHGQADTVRLHFLVLESRAKAEAVAARLRGGSTFQAEAASSLEPRSRAAGGDLGLQTRGQLEPALQQAAFAAPVGEVFGPVPLSLGVGVGRVQERHLGDEQGFAAARNGIARVAVQMARSQARVHYLSQLRKSLKVDVDEAFVQSTGTEIELPPDRADRPVASIAGKPIRYLDILPELRRLSRGKAGGHFSGPSVKMEILRAEIDRRLLEEAAMQRGFGDDPQVAAALRQPRRDALTRALAARIRAAIPPPSSADVEAYYREHASDFRRPGRRTCSQILIETLPVAKAARARLDEGEPFEDVARALSVDESAARGGLLGEVTDDRLREVDRPEGEPALVAVLRTTPAGLVSGPVRSRAGWHLVRCGPHVPEGPAPLAEVSQAIASHLGRQRGDGAVRARLDELRARTEVAIDRAAVERLAAALPSQHP